MLNCCNTLSRDLISPQYIPPNIDIPNFTAGNMRITISVHDTFEVKIKFGKGKMLKIKSNVRTANSTRISRVVLRRRYPKTLLWDKELKLIGKIIHHDNLQL